MEREFDGEDIFLLKQNLKLDLDYGPIRRSFIHKDIRTIKGEKNNIKENKKE